MKLPRLIRKLRPAPSSGCMPGFDEDYYLKQYPDVRQFSGTPLQHYLRHGWREGRDPSVGFSGDGYLAANPDVKASGQNPLTHFLEHGLAEGRTGWDKEPDSPAPVARHQYIRDDPRLNAYVESCMVFMYWTSTELKEPPAAPAWRAIYPKFRVFSDEDVLPLMPSEFALVFKSIRLPSAKSDIARFFLLREHGGLYIDAHVGPTSPVHLMETLGKLKYYKIILFGQGWTMTKVTDFDLMNGVVAARPGAPHLDIVIDRMIENVFEQKAKEDATSDYVPYGLFGLTGTYVIIQSYFDPAPPRPQIKFDLRNDICVHFMNNETDSGFQVAAFYNYRKPNNHWSERQSHERFFL